MKSNIYFQGILHNKYNTLIDEFNTSISKISCERMIYDIFILFMNRITNHGERLLDSISKCIVNELYDTYNKEHTLNISWLEISNEIDILIRYKNELYTWFSQYQCISLCSFILFEQDYTVSISKFKHI